MNWYLGCLEKYATFSGRARRKEYWMFLLIHLIISIILGVFGALVEPFQAAAIIYCLLTLIPWSAVSCRRLHDSNLSGWWQLLPIVNSVLYCFDSQDGENRFGPSPKPARALKNNQNNLIKKASDTLATVKSQVMDLRDGGVEQEKQLILVASDEYYAQALAEISENRQESGLWAKCLVIAEGDRDKATARYIKLRVDQLVAKKQINQIESEVQTNEPVRYYTGPIAQTNEPTRFYTGPIAIELPAERTSPEPSATKKAPENYLSYIFYALLIFVIGIVVVIVNLRGQQPSASEQAAMSQLTSDLEARYPQLNPDSSEYDSELVDQVLTNKKAYEDRGVDRSNALTLAVDDALKAQVHAKSAFSDAPAAEAPPEEAPPEASSGAIEFSDPNTEMARKHRGVAKNQVMQKKAEPKRPAFDEAPPEVLDNQYQNAAPKKYSSLKAVAMSGDVEAARQMLLGGADPNSSTGGTPPLVGAVQADNPEMVKLLLEHGANPNSSTGVTPPLIVAIQSNNPEMVKLLLDHGANPNSRNSRGESAMLIAKVATPPNKEIIDFLLQAGAVNPFAN